MYASEIEWMEEERSREGYHNAADNQSWLIKEMTEESTDLVKERRGKNKDDSCCESDS